MASTTGTGQVLNSSPIVERVLTGQNNQAQHAVQNAAAQLAKKLEKKKETVQQSDNAEKVTIHNNPEEEKKGKNQAGDSEDEAPENGDRTHEADEAPKVKHIDLRA